MNLWKQIAKEIRADAKGHVCSAELNRIAQHIERGDIIAAIDSALELPTEPVDYKTKYCVKLGYRIDL